MSGAFRIPLSLMVDTSVRLSSNPFVSGLTAAAKPKAKPQTDATFTPADYRLIPEGWRLVIASVCYAMCTLSVDYATTILDECARLRLAYMKKQCRFLRSAVNSYTQRKQYYINGQLEQDEIELGLNIEDACKSKLSEVNTLAQSVAVAHGMGEQRYMVSAVAQCLTSTIALTAYCLLLDKKVEQVFRIPRPARLMFLPRELEAIHKSMMTFLPEPLWEALRPKVEEASKDMTETLVGCEVNGCELTRAQKFRRWTKAEERFVMLDLPNITDAQKALCIGRSERALVKKRKELTTLNKTIK